MNGLRITLALSLAGLWFGGAADVHPPSLEEGRKHWAFQPVSDPAPPDVKNAAWPQSPLDRFILAKLESHNLQPAARAEKRVLLRRLTFDLTGLPPTVPEQEAFEADSSPDAVEKVIDRLLASPHYGERWGRHWLDVARYADTAGESADYPIPQAHLYRDWVIAAFNRDLPYDEFLRQQIAGDLMEHSSQEDKNQKVIATGFLALARRFSVDPEREMHLTIEDVLDTLGKSTMGLSLSCARCHDHKFDPVTMEDYYGLYGFFSSTDFPFPGSENKKRQNRLVPLVSQEEFQKLAAPFADRLGPLDQELEALRKEREALAAAQRGEKPEIEPKRTNQQLLDAFRAVRAKRDKITDEMPPVPQAYAVSDAAKAGNARVQQRGEPFNPGPEAPRKFLPVLGGQPLPAGTAGSGRRELAGWIASRSNPLTARVMANRVWHYHFGRGLAATPNDFGLQGRRPTHPELLDWLAARFVEDGWSVKKLHRRILLSATYQQAALTAPPESDPNNELLSGFPRLRLDAESVRDSMLSVAGQLDTSPAGPHPFPAQKTWGFTQHAPFSAVYDTKKRSVYLMQQRIRRHPFLAIFDGPDPNASTAARFVSTTPLQALFVMNDPFVHSQADAFARRLLAEAPDDAQRIALAHRLAFARPSDAQETDQGVSFLAACRSRLGEGGEQKAWASYARVLLGGNEFLYLD